MNKYIGTKDEKLVTCKCFRCEKNYKGVKKDKGLNFCDKCLKLLNGK